MFALNSNLKRITTSSTQLQRRISNKKVCNIVISPILTTSPFSIPDSPEYISIDRINKMTNIYYLKKLELDYDDFLEKKYHILMLLNVIEEIFEIRDTIILRVNALRRKERQRQKNIDYI